MTAKCSDLESHGSGICSESRWLATPKRWLKVRGHDKPRLMGVASRPSTISRWYKSVWLCFCFFFDMYQDNCVFFSPQGSPKKGSV